VGIRRLTIRGASHLMASPNGPASRRRLMPAASAVEVRRWLAPIVVVLLIAGLSVGLGPRADAARRCSIPSGENFGFYTPYVNTTYGARAKIEFRNPVICPDPYGSDGLSVAFVMLQAHSAESPTNNLKNGWAQVGYVRTGSATQIDGNVPGLH